MIETVIQERYQLDAELGRGGGGIVYRGHDSLLEREVAVKVLLDRAAGSDDDRTRLLNEARAAARLDHPNIIPVYDAGLMDNDSPYIVMQLVDGQTLHEARPANLEEIAVIMCQICDALGHAHQHGIFHRDVKPENIVLTADGTAKLMDFGLAHSPASRLTQEGEMMGTAFYIAPEQARGEKVNERADLYALGVVLYELITGQLPFTAENTMAVIVKHLYDPALPPVELNPEIPAGLNDLILQLLAKDPADRPASAQAVRSVLAQWTADGGRALEAARLSAPTDRDVSGPVIKLPALPSSFVGREQDSEEVTDLLADPDCRLLTLAGPGGIGKTRLAVESAARQGPYYPDGVYFVSLSAIATPDYLVPAIAEVLEFPFDIHSSDDAPKVQLLGFLHRRELLLVLDNFEHLLAGADLLSDILEQAPAVNLLVTSRERLNLQGEWVYDVPGLSYPTNGSDGSQYGAVKLFADRARQADARFKLTEEVQPCANHICRLVEGMPLGIELAATWVSVLSCQEIAQEIENNLQFLASSRRDLPDKHRSLYAAFDQSWDLLSEEQQMSFLRCSVFRGGFDRAAAEAVAGVNLMLLSELVNKSLLRRGDDGRYELHEMLRQYAHDKLAALPDELAACRERHSRYYVQFVIDKEPDLPGERLLEVRATVQRERENVHRAMRWAATHWNAEEGQRALLAYHNYLNVQGWHEGATTFMSLVSYMEEAGQASSDNRIYLAARAFAAEFYALLGQGEESAAICDALLPDLRAANDELGLAFCLHAIGTNEIYAGNEDAAMAAYDESIALSERLGLPYMIGESLLWHGWIYLLRKDIEAAEADFLESHRLFESVGSTWGLAFALSKLGLITDAREDFAMSRRYHEEARDIFVTFGDQAGQGYTTSRLAVTAYAEGKHEEAIQFGRMGLESFEAIGHRWGIAVSYCRIGFPALALSDTVMAQSCFMRALARAVEIQHDPLATYALAGIASVYAALGEDQWAAEIFGHVIHHPKSPGLYRETAEKNFAPLAERMPEAVLEASVEAGKAVELADMIARVLDQPVRVQRMAA